MKKLFLLGTLTVLTLMATAQRARLNAYGMYVFDDAFDSYYDPYNYYNGKIAGNFEYGAGVEFMLQPRNCIELMWLHQGTHAPTYYWNGNAQLRESYTDFDLNIDYLLIG